MGGWEKAEEGETTEGGKPSVGSCLLASFGSPLSSFLPVVIMTTSSLKVLSEVKSEVLGVLGDHTSVVTVTTPVVSMTTPSAGE